MQTVTGYYSTPTRDRQASSVGSGFSRTFLHPASFIGAVRL